MTKIQKVLRSAVTIQRVATYKINWIDIEHQIYDEDKITDYTVKVFGLRVWHLHRILVVTHQVQITDKKIGFGSDKIGK